MTINAKEARKQIEEMNREKFEELIKTFDTQIDAAIYEGKFSITTPQLKIEIRNKIIEHYQSYDYEVIDCNNNMLTINW